MIAKIVCFVLLLTVCHLCDLNPNKKMIVIDEPILLNKTENGQKLIIGDLNDP